MNSNLPSNKVEFIKQREEDDCTIATVAMAAGVSYETVIEEITKLKIKYPLSFENEDRVLHKLGCKTIRDVYPKQLEEYSIYILTVPSLNQIGFIHSIVVETLHSCDENTIFLNIFDPQNGIEGKKWYDHDILSSWCHPVKVIRNNSRGKNE